MTSKLRMATPRFEGQELTPYPVEAMAVVPYFCGAKGRVTSVDLQRLQRPDRRRWAGVRHRSSDRSWGDRTSSLRPLHRLDVCGSVRVGYVVL